VGPAYRLGRRAVEVWVGDDVTGVRMSMHRAGLNPDRWTMDALLKEQLPGVGSLRFMISVCSSCPREIN
jgi:hypothetical protein